MFDNEYKVKSYNHNNNNNAMTEASIRMVSDSTTL